MGRFLFLKFLIRSKFDFNKAKSYYDSYDKILKLGLFDESFYLKMYPNIKNSKMEPLEHFLFYGYYEGKYPSSFFSINAYINENPDIKINPLVHYVLKNSKGHIFTKSPSKMAKEKIINTNLLFLKNYQIKNKPLVSIIILNRNGSKHLKRLFKNFDLKTNYDNYEIIVVDNASSDDSIEVLKGFSEILPIKIVQNEKNVSFSKGNNDAVKIANGEYVLLLNNDMEPTFGWLNEMVGTMLKENAGAVGAKLVFPYEYNRKDLIKSFSIQHAGVKFFEENNPYIYSPYHEKMFFNNIFNEKVNTAKESISNTAAALLIPKNIYFKFNGLDENYFYGYEDIDFAFKLLTNGYKTIYCSSALLFHHESATRLNDENAEKINFKNIMYFKNKWNDILFRNILEDKIYHNDFFTEKKLTFAIIDENNYELSSDLSKSFCKMKYDFKVIDDVDNLDIHANTDILISFSLNYDIKKVIARKNLIKILFLENADNLNNIDEYDFVITFNNELKNMLPDYNIFTLFDGKDHGKEIIELIKDVYLN